jgi:hypothetical protein
MSSSTSSSTTTDTTTNPPVELEFDENSPFAETIRNLKREREEIQNGKPTYTHTLSLSLHCFHGVLL